MTWRVWVFILRSVRLLDRYLLGELFLPLAYSLGGFLVFWVAFDLISELDEFQESGLRAGEIAWYYALKLPDFLLVVLPVALLMALLYALTNHARHQELIAMRAAGVSLLRLSLPYFAVGALFSIVLLLLTEQWLPDGAERADSILERRQPAAERVARQLVFYNARDQRNWSVQAFSLDTHEMRGVRLEWLLPDGSRRQVLAERAVWTNGVWVFYQIQEFQYPAEPGSLPLPRQAEQLAIPELTETPDLIKSEIKVSRLTSIRAARRVALSLADIINYRRLHPVLDRSYRALLETQFHARLAAPWTCLVVVLIGVPFGAQSGRRNVFVGVAASIFICFAYFVLLRLGLALGTGGLVAPWIAAWAPNLFFAALGLLLIQRLR